MSRERILSILAITFVAWAVLVTVGPVVGYCQTSKPEPWKFSYKMATNLPTTDLYREWGNVVSQRTGGRFSIELHTAEEFGIQGPEQLSIYGKGVLKIGDFMGNFVMGDEPTLAICGLPFLGSTEKIPEKLNALRPYAEVIFKKYNIIPLAHLDLPNVLWSTFPVETLADFRKLKLRSSSPMVSRLVEQLGGSAVNLPAGDVYTSMGAGIINSATVTFLGGIGWGLNEVCSHAYASPIWNGNSVYVVVNRDAFNALPKDVQKVIVDTAKEYEPKFIKSALMDAMAPDKIEKALKKVTVHKTMNTAMVDQIIKKSALPIWDEWVSKRPGTKPALDAIKAAIGIGK